MSQKNRISLSQSIAVQAPLEMGNQIDLEDLISKSRQQEAERSRFLSTAAAKAAHAEKQKNGELRTVVSQSMIEAFSIGRAKAEQRSKRKNAKQEKVDNKPTPERVAKLQEGDKDVREGTAVKHNTALDVIEKFGPMWKSELEQAARKIRDIWLLAEQGTKSVTANYDGVNGASYGPRHGGVQDHVREAMATKALIEAKFPSCIDDIEWFIAETVCHQDGSAIKFQDSGIRYSPWSAKNIEVAKGIGYGCLMRTLEILAWFLLERAGTSASPEMAASINSAIKAGAQIAREREQKARDRRERDKSFKGGR